MPFAQPSLSLEFLKEYADPRLKDMQRPRKSLAADANRLAKLIGTPAPEWTTEDLAGRRHSLKDYRGKVVVLDFWFRTCIPCIKAMPQVALIAQDFKSGPVVVLGMNTDELPSDAQYVVDKLKIPYQVLKAAALRKAYSIGDFPTLVIIDQAGKIHAIHEGWSPTLREDIGKSIKALLSKR